MNLAEDLFFPLEIMDGSNFQQNKPQRCKTGIKNEVKTSCFGDHIRTWTVISKKKKVFTLFSNQRAARGFNSFSKSGPSCEIIAHPCFNPMDLGSNLSLSGMRSNFETGHRIDFTAFV